MQDRASSIRSQLLTLSATTLVVVAALPVVSGLLEVRRGRVRAEAALIHTSTVVSDEVSGHVRYLERLLDELVRRGRSDLLAPAGTCDSWPRAVEHVPRFAAAMLLSREGSPACTYRVPGGASVAADHYTDRTWFQAAMSADSTVVQAGLVGRSLGMPIAVLARRIPADDGGVAGVASIAVAMNALARALRASLSGSVRLVITTSDGTVLEDSEGPETLGAHYPLRTAGVGDGPTVVRIPTLRGEPMLAVASRVPHADWLIYVGASSDEILATERTILLEHGLLALVGSAIVVILAGFMYRRVVSPVREHMARADSRLAWLTQVAEQSEESVFITDRDGFFVYVNPAFERMSGYTLADISATTPRILRSGAHDPEFYAELWATIEAGGTFRGMITNRARSGETYLEDKVITPIRDAGGHITHFVSSGRDVTAQAALEARLRQSERLEAVGRIAGGVAHDFNNLLTVIKGHARLLERFGPQESASDWAASVQKIIEGTDMASNLTRELLTFGRNEGRAHEGTVLDDEARKVRNILDRILPADIDLDMDLAAPGAAVDLAHAHAGQILMNLSLNARDAMTERGGKLTIRTSVDTVPSDVATDRPGLAHARCVLLEVSDTGRGMSAQVAQNIFEPYYSTKETGSGLGLATVLGVVDDAGGVIDVQTTEGAGTRVRIYLPLTDTSPRPSTPGRATPSLAGSETVVVAEDEENVRRLIADLLERHGYQVIEAADGDEALALVRERGQPVDLLVTDVMMPRMRGVELCERLKRLYPRVRVLFTSGYAEGSDITPEAYSAQEAFLQKPFGPLELLSEVRALLDAPDHPEGDPGSTS